MREIPVSLRYPTRPRQHWNYVAHLGSAVAENGRGVSHAVGNEMLGTARKPLTDRSPEQTHGAKTCMSPSRNNDVIVENNA